MMLGVPVEDTRVCTGKGKNGHEWDVVEYIFGDDLDGAILDEHDGHVITKWRVL